MLGAFRYQSINTQGTGRNLSSSDELKGFAGVVSRLLLL